MKTFSKLVVFCIAIGLYSCSDDDNSTDLNDPSSGVKSNVSIKATTTFNSTAGRLRSANGLQLDAFYINISEIEFEYANASRPTNRSSESDDDDDMNLTFEALPQEIKDYLNQNHPNDAFCKAEMEEDDDEPYKYEVELQSGLELYFKADFTLYAQEQDDEPCGFDDSDDDDPSNSYGGDDEFELAGPFEINLLDAETTTIVNVDIPQGIYEEVEFKMERSNNFNSVLYQKSILITGTLNGTPMTFFHTFEEDFEVDYEDASQNLIIGDSNNNEVTFNFDLNAVVNAVDFSSATDGNADGEIEISPSDTDGNNALANQIKNAIVLYAELID
jgi:hypothetical protein